MLALCSLISRRQIIYFKVLLTQVLMDMLARINVSREPDMHHMRYHLVDGLFICHVPTNWSQFQMDELLYGVLYSIVQGTLLCAMDRYFYTQKYIISLFLFTHMQDESTSAPTHLNWFQGYVQCIVILPGSPNFTIGSLK